MTRHTSVNHDATMQTLSRVLLERELSVATAESCTAGLIGATLTDLAGSSAWFEAGFLTYSNEAKETMLGVSASDLLRCGAVSAEVVTQMAVGALARSHADIAVAVSGVAGPDGGSVEKPVGTVWFGWARLVAPDDDHSDAQAESLPINTSTARMQFDGDRRHVRELAVETALRGIMQIAEGKPVDTREFPCA